MHELFFLVIFLKLHCSLQKMNGQQSMHSVRKLLDSTDENKEEGILYKMRLVEISKNILWIWTWNSYNFNYTVSRPDSTQLKHSEVPEFRPMWNIFMRQCSWSFWRGSWSADPYLWLMDPDPTPFFSERSS